MLCGEVVRINCSTGTPSKSRRRVGMKMKSSHMTNLTAIILQLIHCYRREYDFFLCLCGRNHIQNRAIAMYNIYLYHSINRHVKGNLKLRMWNGFVYKITFRVILMVPQSQLGEATPANGVPPSQCCLHSSLPVQVCFVFNSQLSFQKRLHFVYIESIKVMASVLHLPCVLDKKCVLM